MGNGGLALSLLFAAADRLTARDVKGMAEQDGAGFSVVADLDSADNGMVGLELLCNGLTYDLLGLSPGEGTKPPRPASALGFEQSRLPADLGALTLRPAPHIAGGAAMMPVVRMLAWLGAQLAGRSACLAVLWHPSASLAAPDLYVRTVNGWLEGGVFPGLVLVGVTFGEDGMLISRGLSLFAGAELELAADLSSNKEQASRIAVRLMDAVAGKPHLTESEHVELGAGLPEVEIVPDYQMGRIRVRPVR